MKQHQPPLSPTPEVSPFYMQKFLHTEQPFPDNYIEDWFLSGMKINAHLEIQPLSNVVFESFALTQQMSSVILFLCVFLLTTDGVVSLRTVYMTDVFLITACFLSCIPLKISLSAYCGSRNVVLFGCVWGFVPVISTVTTGYDPNTIYLLVGGIFILHLAFFDYGYANNYVDKINGAISFNAAIVATIVLASLLSENSMVFPIISFSILLFQYLPILRHFLNKSFKSIYVAVTVILMYVTIYSLSYFSWKYVLFYCFTAFLTNFVGPHLWIKIQSLKTEMSGAWDEAVPSIN
ncbi:Phosphatidylinositol N-acetylglucosaminyltransferase subunit C [Entamoeba marina]